MNEAEKWRKEEELSGRVDGWLKREEEMDERWNERFREAKKWKVIE